MRLILVTALLAALTGGLSAQGGWRLETSNAPWTERGDHYSAVFDNKHWIIGGHAGAGGSFADVWTTSDGVNWNLQTSLAGLGMSNHGVMLAFNGELWMLGGGNTSMVWRSPDGINWTQEPDAPWLGRSYAAGVVFNSKMWVFGGWTQQPPYQYSLNDVWSTTDGVNWTQEVAAANWSARFGHTAAVFNNRMWILGGGSPTGRDDIWSSADGINWVEESANAEWEPRGGHQTVVYRNRLWVIGGAWGNGLATYYYDNAWSSPDGVNWVQESDGTPWGERTAHAAVVFKNRIWLTGGTIIGTGYLNDVWSYGLHVSPDALPGGIVDTPYNADLEAREGDGPFTWSLIGGALPPGLTLDTLPTDATIPVTGTPEATGTYTFTVQLEDNDGNTIEQDITLTINPPPPIGGDSNDSSGCTAAPSGLPWTLLYGALALSAAATLCRRRLGL